MLLIIFLLVVGTTLVWIGSVWLDSSSIRISNYYNVPDVVRGSIITAFGSSFPELSSVVVATVIHGELELGIGIVIGSAIFNVLVIPGLSGIRSGGMSIDGDIVSKEIGIYAMVVLSLGGFFVASNYITNNGLELSKETILNPYLATVLLLLYCIYVFYQWKLSKNISKSGKESNIEDIRTDWIKISVSLVLIGLGVEALVRSVIEIGNLLNTPSFFWGLIIVAGSSSLPDAFVSVKQAGDKNYSTSITNVIGSNIFDLLVVLSVGVVLSTGVSININSIIPLLIFLFATNIMMYLFSRRGKISRVNSYTMILGYIVFVIWIILEAFGYS
jgi:cation:H+ antiporter